MEKNTETESKANAENTSGTQTAREKQEKLHKTMKRVLIGLVLFFVLFLVILGVTSAVRRSRENDRLNARQKTLNTLFEDTELKDGGASPRIKRPYTVYERKGNGQEWKYSGMASETPESIAESYPVLFRDEGITAETGDARTLVFIWTDISLKDRTNSVYWSSGETAFYCPVYMTVIDREEGLRYQDIQIASVVATRNEIRGSLYSKHAGEYNKPSIDLDQWANNHWSSK